MNAPWLVGQEKAESAAKHTAAGIFKVPPHGRLSRCAVALQDGLDHSHMFGLNADQALMTFA
jgi:hypothetical protein